MTPKLIALALTALALMGCATTYETQPQDPGYIYAERPGADIIIGF